MQETALDVVAGYCICHDVSEREYQIERGGPWMKGKSSCQKPPRFLCDGQTVTLGIDGLGNKLSTFGPARSR